MEPVEQDLRSGVDLALGGHSRVLTRLIRSRLDSVGVQASRAGSVIATTVVVIVVATIVVVSFGPLL